MGILRRNNRDMTDHPETRRARSQYSDMMLAEQFTNPQAILDRIRVRPRLASPSLVRPEITRQSVRRVKRRQKRLRWSDANMARSASSDHLANMRSSCHCSCDLEDRRGMSLSVGSLCHLLEDSQDSQVKSRENTENNARVKSGEHHGEYHGEHHVYVNCDPDDHLEAYTSLMGILRDQGQRQNTGRQRKQPRIIHNLTPGCMSDVCTVELLLREFLSHKLIHHSMKGKF